MELRVALILLEVQVLAQMKEEQAHTPLIILA